MATAIPTDLADALRYAQMHNAALNQQGSFSQLTGLAQTASGLSNAFQYGGQLQQNTAREVALRQAHAEYELRKYLEARPELFNAPIQRIQKKIFIEKPKLSFHQRLRAEIEDWLPKLSAA